MKKLTKIPQSDSAIFIGRDQEIVQIQHLLADNSTKALCVSGLAGIGKTAFMQNYVWSEHCALTFRYLAWITVIPGKNFREQLLDLFALSDYFNFRGDESFMANYTRLVNFLLSTENILLVIDAIENQELINEIAREFSEIDGKIVFTSREQAAGFREIDLKPLSVSDARALFYQHFTKEKNDALVDEMLEKVEHNTLLINLLSVLAQNNEKAGLDALRKTICSKPSGSGILWSVIRPTDESDEARMFNCIEELIGFSNLSKEELWIACIISFLPADKAYTPEFLADLMYIKPEQVEVFNQRLEKLYTSGLLSYSVDAVKIARYTMHRIICWTIHTRLKPQLDPYSNIVWRLALKLSVADEKADPLKEKLWWAEISESFIAYFGVPQSKKETEHIKSLALLYNNLALCLQDLSRFEKALHYQLCAVELTEKYADPPTQTLAKYFNNLASIYNDLGNIDQSLVFQKKTISIKEQILKPGDPSLARSYNNISILYKTLKNYDEAIDYQLKAIEIRKQLPDSPNKELAGSYNNLASIYSDLNDKGRALACQVKAFDIYKTIFKAPHPAMAVILNNLALLYADLGNTEKALETHLFALDIRKTCLPSTHVDLENTYSNLASLYMKTGQYQKALSNIDHSLKILAVNFKPDHPSVLNAKQIKEQIVNQLATLN